MADPKPPTDPAPPPPTAHPHVRKRTRVKHVLMTIATMIAVVAGGAGVALYLGLYNVGALRPHLEITYKFLAIGMTRSVDEHAEDIVAPPLDDEALVRRGLVLYQRHCLQCHGAPGVAPEAFALGMVPHPAPLSHTAREWPANEVFWVIKHGIKMSGMPAWAFRLSEDEMWAITAFTMRLPWLAPLEYEAMVRAVGDATPVRHGAAAAEREEGAPLTDGAVPGEPAKAAARASEEAARAEASRAARSIAIAIARPPGATREFDFVAKPARSTPPAAGATLAPIGDVVRGRVAIYQYVCTACHHIPGTERAGSAPVGPPLEAIGTRAVLAGVLPNTPENMVRWLREPREVNPRSAMPDLGLTDRDARDIAAYLYTLR